MGLTVSDIDAFELKSARINSRDKTDDVSWNWWSADGKDRLYMDGFSKWDKRNVHLDLRTWELEGLSGRWNTDVDADYDAQMLTVTATNTFGPTDKEIGVVFRYNPDGENNDDVSEL